jgi:thioredoxin 1
MTTPLRIVIVVMFVVGLAATERGWGANDLTNNSPPAATAAAKLPKLLDLGATKCIPCRMMAPILEKLKKDYEGRLEVEFIDVWQNPDAGKQYKIELIPTQIFYSDSGKELFRHVGFYGRDDILARWKKLGVDLNHRPGSTELVEPSVPPKPGKKKHD